MENKVLVVVTDNLMHEGFFFLSIFDITNLEHLAQIEIIYFS
jgi:hypothetical protein